jgi:hypothetical protein
MKVQFSAPRGNGPDGEGFSRMVGLPLVPSVGDSVEIDGSSYRVHLVAWYPFGDKDDDEPFAYVVLRR